MRYLSLAEALVIAEEVTGTGAETLALNLRIGLLDSAIHAPQAEFDGHQMYPEFADKAAVLAVRIAKNHPLIDGNKRLAWACLNMFCALNGRALEVSIDDAVSTMFTVADGSTGEAEMSHWIRQHLSPAIDA